MSVPSVLLSPSLAGSVVVGGGMTGVIGAGGWKGENQRQEKGRPKTFARDSRFESRGLAEPLSRFMLSTA